MSSPVALSQKLLNPACRNLKKFGEVFLSSLAIFISVKNPFAEINGIREYDDGFPPCEIGIPMRHPGGYRLRTYSKTWNALADLEAKVEKGDPGFRHNRSCNDRCDQKASSQTSTRDALNPRYTWRYAAPR